MNIQKGYATLNIYNDYDNMNIYKDCVAINIYTYQFDFFIGVDMVMCHALVRGHYHVNDW